MTTQPHQKKYDIVHSKEVFLAKEWHCFHRFGKKLDCLHLKDILKYECELYFKQPLTSQRCKIIVAYHTSNHRLAIETRRWMSISISRNTRLTVLLLLNPKMTWRTKTVLDYFQSEFEGIC